MNITVKTTYDLEAFKMLNRLTLFRGKKPIGRLIILGFPIICVLMVGLQSAEMLRPCLVFCGWFGLIEALMIYNAYGLPRLQYNRQRKQGVPELVFTFGDETLSWVSHSENMSGSSEVKYSALHKAVEMGHYFFIYIAANQALMVDKNGIENGSAEEIAAVLSSNLGRKFKKIKVK